MHSLVSGALRTALRPVVGRSACRFVGRTRYSSPRRNFHRSAASYGIPEDNREGGSGKDNTSPETPEQPEKGEVKSNATSASASVDAESSAVARKTRGRLRANRQRQPEGLPPVVLPDWFWDKNVKCFGDPALSGSLTLHGKSHYLRENGAYAAALKDLDLPGLGDAKYSIGVPIFLEILSTLKATLGLRPPRTGNKVQQTVLHLHYPEFGGTYYLDSVVETAANMLKADVVRLDAQDIAQIVGPYVDENLAWADSETSLLGYEASKHTDSLGPEGVGVEEREDGDKSNSGELEGMPTSPLLEALRGMRKNRDDSERLPRSRGIQRGVEKAEGADRWKERAKSKSHGGQQPIFEIYGVGNDINLQGSSKPGTDHWSDLKLVAAADALVRAADSKRARSSKSGELATPDSETSARPLIIQVNDYRGLEESSRGPDLLRALRLAVSKLWHEGREIILVGTTSDILGRVSRSAIQALENSSEYGEPIAIVVPPNDIAEEETAVQSDKNARIRRFNIRHIEDMIIKLDDGNQNSSLVVNIEKDLDSGTADASGLEGSLWPYARVRKVATVILGLHNPPAHVDGSLFAEAMTMVNASDDAKFAWSTVERRRRIRELGGLEDTTKVPDDATRAKIKEIEKLCSPREKKLLSGVRIPSELNTTFADVHAPKDIVEALKTLTSLSLSRPEAFSYGVLAKDKIPGLLLYGPPGTGKTLLAKAVAKESGATMLEISGANVNEMYVGEGEKNVRAIFELAKKLTPCVVFIDEADAIFAARGDAKRGRAHRELINQFLKEWDGMADTSAFMMVATNRPFDLDEAVLRRLPRRLLIDLPMATNREAILAIHLQDELLDPSVSLADIARETPFYSGSDLKNVAVAAAMACLREENALAAAHTGDEPHVFPEKRVLTKQHFDKALEEISASISEDMSTLSAIRKFDAKYGDRKGRKKKGASLGFGGTTVEEKDSEAGRVRNVDV